MPTSSKPCRVRGDQIFIRRVRTLSQTWTVSSTRPSILRRAQLPQGFPSGRFHLLDHHSRCRVRHKFLGTGVSSWTHVKFSARHCRVPAAAQYLPTRYRRVHRRLGCSHRFDRRNCRRHRCTIQRWVSNHSHSHQVLARRDHSERRRSCIRSSHFVRNVPKFEVHVIVFRLPLDTTWIVEIWRHTGLLVAEGCRCVRMRLRLYYRHNHYRHPSQLSKVRRLGKAGVAFEANIRTYARQLSGLLTSARHHLCTVLRQLREYPE